MTLDPDALRDLVDAVAADRDAWIARVPRHLSERHFEVLRRDDDVEVWLICWGGEDHDTGFHDHDVSSGAFAVAEGELVEERPAIGNVIRRRLRRGASLSFGPSHVHRVHGVGDRTAVSIHAYSPPLARLGVYEVAPDGALRRETVAADHELRAAGQAA